MFDWQQYTQSIIFGLIFSFLVSKLFSIISSFRNQNLRLTRSEEHESSSSSTPIDDDYKQEVDREAVISNDDNNDSDDDDWEGVESTELDEAFSAATAFVAATAADKESKKVSSEVQLELYGLYKIATEGPCTAPQPSAIKMTARAKW